MTEYPRDVPLALDRSVRSARNGQVLVGGDPPRALRLAEGAAAAIAQLRATGAGPSAATRRLARRLVDGGLAHPHPHPVPVPADAAAVTVIVPVRDRPGALDACLASVGAPVVVVDDGSLDAAAVAAVCDRRGARLVRRETPGGPAVARNTALAHVHTEFVAFLDSDCVAEAGWLGSLVGHFADPLVAAVAPRVRGASAPGGGAVGRFAAARSPLDAGPYPARVVPGGRVAYVPTAALVVRRAALGGGFDPQLRYGEDVDLVWRLHDAGWHVRYEPAAGVRHVEPSRWRALLGRRFRYGTSAAPLAARHPGRLAPLVVHPWSAAVLTLTLGRRPGLAATVAAAQGAVLARRLKPVGVPVTAALTRTLAGTAQTALVTGRTATMLAPVAVLAAVAHRRTRVPALALLAGPPLAEWCRLRPPLDPLRWTALCVADDAAYGAGVWVGAARSGTLAPLRPARSRRSGP